MLFKSTSAGGIQRYAGAAKQPCGNQALFVNIYVTSLSSRDDDVVITPVVGCIEKRVGDAGNCSMMEYLRRVCSVSASSLSVAQTCPTVVPTYRKILLNFQNFYSFNLPFI